MAQSVASTSQNFPRGRSVVTFTGDVARTDTSAKELFTLRKGDIPLGLRIVGVAASNAGTNARLSVGSTGNATYFAAALDVKSTALTSGGVGQAIPSSAANLGVPLDFDTTVTATYAEAGSAATSGGPWIVVMDVLTV